MGTSFLRSEIRSVLSKNRIDQVRLRVGVFGSVVRLQGVLVRVHGQSQLSHEALEGLEREIRRIPGVKRVELLLENWRRQASHWAQVQGRALQTIEPAPLELDPAELEPLERELQESVPMARPSAA